MPYAATATGERPVTLPRHGRGCATRRLIEQVGDSMQMIATARRHDGDDPADRRGQTNRAGASIRRARPRTSLRLRSTMISLPNVDARNAPVPAVECRMSQSAGRATTSCTLRILRTAHQQYRHSGRCTTGRVAEFRRVAARAATDECAGEALSAKLFYALRRRCTEFASCDVAEQSLTRITTATSARIGLAMR